MYYHRPHSLAQEMKKYGVDKSEMSSHNRKRKKALVAQGRSHGIIVYSGNQPVGWCQYGLKDELPRIDRGRFYRKLGLEDVPRRLWRMSCFFVDRDYRGRGVARTALKAALESIKEQGGGVVEAYPVVSKALSAEAQWIWFGTPSMFRRERFKPVSPLGTSYLLMRKTIS